MLLIIAAILIVLFLLGVVTAYTLGGLIYILLVVAIAAILIHIIKGRRS
ncbi:MAG: lmo0937 family membrane protein [bacterium]